MVNSIESSIPTDSCNDQTEGTSITSRGRTFRLGKYRVPRRYAAAAAMTLALILIPQWKFLSTDVVDTEIIKLTVDERYEMYPSLADYTSDKIIELKVISQYVHVAVQIPAGLLLLYVSSYRLLLVTIPCLSLLNILTPFILKGHMYLITSIVILKDVLGAAAYITVLCFWKDWSPPKERNRLLIISFYGLFLQNPITALLLPLDLPLRAPLISTGVIGLVWTFLWLVMFSDTPYNDPLITEEELTYIQNSIPTPIKEKTKITSVPWLNILTSKAIWVLCFLFFELSISQEITSGATLLYFAFDGDDLEMIKMSNIALFLASIMLVLSTLLLDHFLAKYRNRSLRIRKGFLCGVFLLKATLLLAISLSELRGYLCVIVYIITITSIPGFFAITMNVSPRFVPVTGSICYTSYFLGSLLIMEYLTYIDLKGLKEMAIVTYLPLAVFALASSIIFFLWGSDEEESWSFILHTKSKSIKHYQKPDDTDDTNLVEEQA